MSERPTLKELDDFRGFCQQATDTQLYNIYWKEMGAHRFDYAREARLVAEARGVDLLR